MSVFKYDASMPFEFGDLERRLIAELEAQQTHIAQELHDALGSQLSAIVMMLGAMQKLQPQNHPQSQALDQLMQQAQAAVQTTRRLARGLMPVDKEPGALWRVLERLCLDYDQIAGRSCQLIIQDGLSWVAPELANPLYRIAQEAVTNAFRNGHAHHVVLSIMPLRELGSMTVQDDGIGMPSDQFDAAYLQGIGLRTMRARAQAAGVTLAFEKNSVVGTTVRVTWPIIGLATRPATTQP
jgi:signal transduction histidine kinase